MNINFSVCSKQYISPHEPVSSQRAGVTARVTVRNNTLSRPSHLHTTSNIFHSWQNFTKVIPKCVLGSGEVHVNLIWYSNTSPTFLTNLVENNFKLENVSYFLISYFLLYTLGQKSILPCLRCLVWTQGPDDLLASNYFILNSDHKTE